MVLWISVYIAESKQQLQPRAGVRGVVAGFVLDSNRGFVVAKKKHQCIAVYHEGHFPLFCFSLLLLLKIIKKKMDFLDFSFLSE